MIAASAEWPSFWVQFAYTVVTAFILVAAIWDDWLRTRFWGPRLKVTLLDSKSFLTTRTGGAAVRYFHLRIDNHRRWAPARSVKLLCTDLAKGPGGTTLTRVPLPIPLQLMWSFPQYRPLTPTIVSDDRCDLGNFGPGR